MKGQGSRRWCTALSLLTMVFLVGISLTNGWVAGVALAAHPALSGAELSIGFNGVYRTGSWTPLVVTVPAVRSVDSSDEQSAASPLLYAWAEDSDGQYVRSPPTQITVAADGTHTAHFCLRFGRPTARVRIEQPPYEPVLHALPPPIDSTQRVILVLGDLPSAERAARLLSREDGSRPRVIAITKPTTIVAPQRLPLGRSPRDFDGADAIIVCGQSAQWLDADTIAGIDGWARRGGRLIFCSGASAQQIGQQIEKTRKLLADWLPGPIAKMLPLRRMSAIETYARASRPLEKNATAGLEVPLLANARTLLGSVDAYEGSSPGDLPLVVRRAYGFGTLTWIGIDIDQGAFRNWQGTDTLVVELLGGRSEGRQSGRAGETLRGRLDLAGQLRTAVDQFPNLRAVPFEIIAGLGILYVAALYPLDWWLVSRGVKRPWLAWLTLPGIVAAACGVAWGTAEYYKGNQWQSSRADLLDIDLTQRLVRGISYAGVWSPLNALLDVSAQPTNLPELSGLADVGISWYGTAGRGIGATDAPLPHPSLATTDYTYGASLEAIDSVPIAASSSRLFEAEWSATAAAAPLAAALSRDAQSTLRGSLTSQLPFPLHECLLLHAGWIYDVGLLEPGGCYQPALGRGPRSLAGALTRRTANKDRDFSVRWDTEDRDIDRILEVAGFHAAAGGSAYTSLEAGRLGRFDLSGLLEIDRAVLVGKGPSGTAWAIESLAKENALSNDSLSAGRQQNPSLAPAITASLWRIVIPLDNRAEAPSTEAASHEPHLPMRQPPKLKNFSHD